ncbi:MAG TPA: mannonate dehydratase [Bacteroidales bacterium]|nr:mannonate dehydratase [Bacteroidales bacterium]
MKNNRRDFIKKTAIFTTTASLAGLMSTCTQSTYKDKSSGLEPGPYVKDGGIKFAFLNSPTSPKVPFARQLAVNYAVSGVERIRGLNAWDPEAIKATKAAWDREGIKWYVVEGPPSLGTKTKLGLDGRDEEISNFITFMKYLKQYGDVDIICYNWMPVISWARTNQERPGRGGALMLEFDYEVMKPAPLTEYGEVSKEHLWTTLEYFVKAVMPEAEKTGMRMSMHPDDPQVDVIQGISRIMNTVAGHERLLSMYPKPCNGITMCQANYMGMPDLVNIPGLIRRWGRDIINFVHFRNVKDLSGVRPSTHFTETFHDEGDIDMYEAMKAYIEIGFDGPMRPDHVPVMATETEAGMRGGYTTLGNLYAIGYMRGLAEAVAKELSRS